MGGIGSSRWKDHQRAPRVEDTLQLDVVAFEPALKHDQITGRLQWTDNQAGEVTAESVFSLEPVSRDGSRLLVIEATGEGRKQSVQLERAQRGWYSGWLFQCPSDCGRRARKLYALPRWMVFSCRQCAGLTYRSAQQHDSRLDLARRDPEGFIQARSLAPKTENSGMATHWLVMEAMNTHRRGRTPGRSWGRKSTTTWSRFDARMRQEYIDRWGFPPEDAGKVARGG
jgi:hypothetical protein